MNILSDIISNALDLASAGEIELKLNSAMLYAMNVVADMENELAHSARGRQAVKIVQSSFTPNEATGTMSALPTFIRYRRDTFSKWLIIAIVSDIEDLSSAETHNQPAILFYGENPYNYQLSFLPETGNVAELWGAAAAGEPNGLTAAPKFPAAYTHLAANRTAILLLDDVLLIHTAPNLIPFVQSKKQTLMNRQRDLEHRWTVYRSNADNSLADAVALPYDPFAPEEYGAAFRNS